MTGFRMFLSEGVFHIILFLLFRRSLQFSRDESTAACVKPRSRPSARELLYVRGAELCPGRSTGDTEPRAERGGACGSTRTGGRSGERPGALLGNFWY